MKKKSIIGLLLTTLSLTLFVVGCSKSSVEKPNSDVQYSVESLSEEHSTKPRSGEDLYKLYTLNLEEVKKVFNDNGLKYSEEKISSDVKYLDTINIEHVAPEYNNDYFLANYSVGLNDEGDVMYIIINANLGIDTKSMKSKEFKFEDTLFSKLHSIFIKDSDVTDEMNVGVNGKYRNSSTIASVDFVYNDGTIEESLYLGDNTLDYTLVIRL